MKLFCMFTAVLLAAIAQCAVAADKSNGITYQDVKLQIARIQVQDSVSFDDAVESLKLRANQHNLKFVGVNAIYKEIESLTGKPAKRMEIFNFCDGLTANKMLQADITMIAYMPCRIAILEDAQGKRWVISMMMDLAKVKKLPADARASAERVMAAMKDMMVAASSGDL
ncbi:MAG: DUF302 domain-containing protein [Gammaproteobacteria bacterium]|nr:DUF302 domain-containing protein [Gammaproteobacteria bacterium]MBU1969935.1 DUF302 domain-containing protein [Gammaproteobacteria bacterium]